MRLIAIAPEGQRPHLEPQERLRNAGGTEPFRQGLKGLPGMGLPLAWRKDGQHRLALLQALPQVRFARCLLLGPALRLQDRKLVAEPGHSPGRPSLRWRRVAAVEGGKVVRKRRVQAAPPQAPGQRSQLAHARHEAVLGQQLSRLGDRDGVGVRHPVLLDDRPVGALENTCKTIGIIVVVSSFVVRGGGGLGGRSGFAVPSR